MRFHPRQLIITPGIQRHGGLDLLGLTSKKLVQTSDHVSEREWRRDSSTSSHLPQWKFMREPPHTSDIHKRGTGRVSKLLLFLLLEQ